MIKETSENLEGYVDDAENVITSDAEFFIVDEILSRFERTSGAILNRSSKSKVMGLGAWKNRECWPLKWLKVEKRLKIFGFIMAPSYNDTLNENWADQLLKLQRSFHAWSSRVFETLSQRAEVITTFALSTVWFRAQVLSLSNFWAKKFVKEICSFLWKGQPYRNVLPFETVCLPKEKGGLGIPFFQAKCDARLRL